MKNELFDIRPASVEDLVTLAEIEQKSSLTPWSVKSIGSFIQDDLYRACFVSSKNASTSEVFGYVAIQYVFDEAEISNIAVSPEMRRIGAGRALLGKVFAYLSDKGVRTIFLEVRESNVSARSLYETFGFQPVGRRAGYYQSPEEDAILYRVSIKFPSANC